jgi:hypothetical protein
VSVEGTFLSIVVVALGAVLAVAMWRWQVMMTRAFRAELTLLMAIRILDRLRGGRLLACGDQQDCHGCKGEFPRGRGAAESHESGAWHLDDCPSKRAVALLDCIEKTMGLKP